MSDNQPNENVVQSIGLAIGVVLVLFAFTVYVLGAVKWNW